VSPAELATAPAALDAAGTPDFGGTGRSFLFRATPRRGPDRAVMADRRRLGQLRRPVVWALVPGRLAGSLGAQPPGPAKGGEANGTGGLGGQAQQIRAECRGGRHRRGCAVRIGQRNNISPERFSASSGCLGLSASWRVRPGARPLMGIGG